MIAETLVKAFTHLGKKHSSFDRAMEFMPDEFYMKLNEVQQDKVEAELKKHFGSIEE